VGMMSFELMTTTGFDFKFFSSLLRFEIKSSLLMLLYLILNYLFFRGANLIQNYEADGMFIKLNPVCYDLCWFGVWAVEIPTDA
jgi:hypothetical protein